MINFFSAGVFVCCAALSTANNANAANQGCSPLKDKDHGWSVMVTEPGTYCMTAGLLQTEPPAFLRLPHQPVPTDPLLTIDTRNVTVDLDGRELRAKIPSALGLWVNGGREVKNFSIQVRNGRIATEKQPVVFMIYAWNRLNKRFSENSGAAKLAVAHSLDEYPKTAFVLENLTLEAHNVAVILQGRNNVIRHCKIIGGNGTVNLYGPGLIFEDNEIILNASEAKPGGEAAVALYLEDADDSVVRNNRITIRGRVAGAEAIVLKNSSGVILQNNTVNGGAQTYKLLDQQSSVR